MKIPGVLFWIFVVLKLLGLITWSWWWVTSPAWITVVVAVVMLSCGWRPERKR